MARGYKESMPDELKAKYNSPRDRAATNSAMVGKARRESLLEKRKAMPKRKKQVASIPKPVGPIGL